MMTAHLVYDALDPLFPATLSPTVIERTIRGQIGFEGVLVTDDLAMKALSGVPADLAVRALKAGCDIALYCSGDFALTEDLLWGCPPLTPITLRRLSAARELVQKARQALRPNVLAAERDRLVA